MIRTLTLAALLLAFAFPARAADVYRSYTNVRFGFRVSYPANLLVAGREADNSDGQRFESRDKAILLRVFGAFNVEDKTLAAKMQSVARAWRADGARITYRKSGANWYVLSGVVGGDIFYEKTMVRGDRFATLIWEYPRAQRRRLDTPVTRAVKSFGFVEREPSRRVNVVRSSPLPKRAAAPAPPATPVGSGY